MSDSALLTLAQQYAAAAEARDTAALVRLVRAYQRMYSRLAMQIEMLAEQVGNGAMTTGQLARLTRFKSLMSQIETELSNYSVVVTNELSDSAEAALTRALSDSRNLINTAAREAGITAGFNSLPKQTVIRLLGFLQDGSPLMQRLATLAPYHAEAMRELFIDGVGLGWNPRKIAAALRKQFGVSLTDALRMTRTAQVYSYREATRANYVASEIVVGWQWMANLSSPRTCMACISLSGRVFPTKAGLNDHYNGRCTMLPVIRNRDPFISESEGVDYFNGLPESEQAKRMGPKFYEQYKAGKFTLKDMPREVDDDVYGKMWTTTPLKVLMGG